MNAYTSTVVIDAPPQKVFEYVRVPENQVQWAVNFVRSTRPVGGGTYEMETPVGTLAYRLETDADCGTIDWVFSTPHGENVLPARVVRHAGGSLFTFTITRAPDASDEDWARGKAGMDEELGVLKRLLES